MCALNNQWSLEEGWVTAQQFAGLLTEFVTFCGRQSAPGSAACIDQLALIKVLQPVCYQFMSDAVAAYIVEAIVNAALFEPFTGIPAFVTVRNAVDDSQRISLHAGVR